MLAGATPAQQRVLDELKPTLDNALVALCKYRPAEPISWLAHYLVENKPPKLLGRDVSFEVDAVEPCRVKLAALTVQESWNAQTDNERASLAPLQLRPQVVSTTPPRPLVDVTHLPELGSRKSSGSFAWSVRWNGLNSLLAAVNAAFVCHYPLTLSPDAIWTAIIQGFSLHMHQGGGAEQLRPLLVRHAGKKTLRVTVDAGALDEIDGWRAALSSFSAVIQGEIGADHYACLVPQFSTTGADERLVFELSLMACLETYFDFDVAAVCGIPRITLLGTQSDWEGLYAKVAQWRQAYPGLEWWLDHLLPVLQAFAEAAAGKAAENVDFWRRIYKAPTAAHYGGDPRVTGWINVFFPYLESFDSVPSENPDDVSEEEVTARLRAEAAAGWRVPNTKIQFEYEWQFDAVASESEGCYMWRDPSSGELFGVELDPEAERFYLSQITDDEMRTVYIRNESMDWKQHKPNLPPLDDDENEEGGEEDYVGQHDEIRQARRRERGPELKEFPSGLCTFGVQAVRASGAEEACLVVSGFCGVSQAEDTLALRPELGWAVYGEETDDEPSTPL